VLELKGGKLSRNRSKGEMQENKEFDLEQLNDDDLLKLLKAAMAEASDRGGLIANQAEAEKQERIRIEKQKNLEQEQQTKKDKIIRQWRIKMAAITAVRQWGYDEDFALAIWSQDVDRRVYFQMEGDRYKNGWKVTLYLTGNSSHPPGKMTYEGKGCWFADKKKEVKAFLQAFANTWQGDIKISSDDYQDDIIPSEKHLSDYLNAIGVICVQSTSN